MTFVVTAAAIAATGTVLSTVAQVQAGKAAEEAAEIAAEEQRIAAQNEELKRREELNRVLASNILSQAVSGIDSTGSRKSLALKATRTISGSESFEGLKSRLMQDSTILQGKTAKSMANMQAGASLLQGASSLATDINTIKTT